MRNVGWTEGSVAALTTAQAGYFINLLVMHPWPSCNGRTRNAVSMSMSMINKHIRKITYNNQYKLGKMNTVMQRQLDAFAARCTKPTPALPLNSK